MSVPVVAAVDIGTNSTRLLVTDGTSDLHREAVVTGLGRGVASSGELSARGIEETCATLGRYRRLAADLDAAGVVAVATAAARTARNTGEFLAAATEALGAVPRVIDGDTEAHLSFLGALTDLDGADWTIVDIGGGSTEVVSEDAVVSLPVGSVRITESFFTDGPADADTVDAALAEARRHLSECAPARRVAGVAGTWTSLAAIEAGVGRYDPQIVHHSVLTGEQVRVWVDRLAAMSVDERRMLAGLDPARGPVILGGAVVAAAVIERLGAEVLVSERDLLDGLAAEAATDGRFGHDGPAGGSSKG